MKTVEELWKDCLEGLEPHERPTTKQEELRMKIAFMDGCARGIAELQARRKEICYDS